ncbi:S100 calcium binding protein U [Plectropomus leopardus]|uniref:S100 calcium binding protein U n=1 Tax=Plectropomus leopardus TaxID=160734 RepID=UPI001C4D6C9D|nr:S100 calcium binding protein U [Plectropomus leopardus]
MEAAIQTVVKVFLKSTKGKESLGKNQFQSLVKSQLSNILSDTDSKEAVNNMGQGLDANHDGKVGFEEYLKLVGYLAVSLSEQRNLAKEEPAQNAASGQVAQSTPDKEEEKPEANAEVKEEAKPEANEEAKVEAVSVVTVEEKADGTVETVVETVEIKSEGDTQPEVAAAVVAAALEEAAAGGEVVVVVKEDDKKDETEKVVEIAEKLAAAVDEEVEKKIEEATS